ncbi:MAG: LamG domain-containing protein [Kiritimatiellae bacterium]|nr:LamG domain-containing protein [Kiritimatiellia bacterium]
MKTTRFLLISAAIVMFLYAALPAQAVLVGEWRFDEGSGWTTADDSGHSNNGTNLYMDPAACWVTGKSGYALSFTGLYEYVRCGANSSLAITNEITIEAWVKPDTRPEYHIIVSRSSLTYWLAINSGRAALLIAKQDRSGWNVTLLGQTILDSNRWYHIVGTYKDGMAKIYINGNLDGRWLGSDEGIGTLNANLTIGATYPYYPATYHFNGVIDEVKIYNNALSESEIQDHYFNAGWHFDEGSGTSAADYSAYQNDGTLMNMGPSSWVDGELDPALEFDGTDDYVIAPNNASLKITSELTVQAWVKPDTRAGYHPIADKGDYSYYFGTYAGKAVLLIGKAGGSEWNVTAIGNTTLNGSNWYHLVGTYINGAGRVYVDGLLDGYGVGTNEDMGVSDVPLAIGASADSADYFDGVIDELQIYSRALTDWEIRQWSVGMDIRANLEFDEGEGGTASDGSGYNNTGYLMNMNTTNCWVNGRIGYALAFDGTNDYVKCSNNISLQITNEITVEAWVKPDTNPGYHVIACKGSYTYMFYTTGARKACLMIAKGSISGASYNVIVTGTNILDSTKWCHLVGTYQSKSGVGKIYVNGLQSGTATGSNTVIRSNGSHLSIGSASSYAYTYYYSNVIDQVNIFAKELSASQILQRFEDHGGQYGFGCEEQPTGDPIGGGAGYSNICSASIADYVVNTKTELLTALANAQSGDIIFVVSNAVIDLSGMQRITIPGGVILASDRGTNGSAGALIQSTYDAGVWPLFTCGGPNVSISGLRLQGPHLTQTPTYESAGILCAYNGLEIENCEISGWSVAGIRLDDGGTNAYIHHNYIHHCQRAGYGYGISHGYGTATSLIEANKFDYNRHSVAGTGTPGNSYEARYNLALENANGSTFDMHGGKDRGDGTVIAGDNIYIHHNTTKCISTWGAGIRGIPNYEALVYNNWFAGPYTVCQIGLVVGVVGGSDVNMDAYMNLEGTNRVLSVWW